MATERIRIGDDYYLLASSIAPTRTRGVLSHEEGFGIFDASGDIPLGAGESFGLFQSGTRFLDRFELRLNGGFPVPLSSVIGDEADQLVSVLSNPDERRNGEVVLLRDTVGIERSKTLHDRSLVERLALHNYGAERVRFELAVLFAADFVDVFELRGIQRDRRGELRPAEVDGDRVRFSYVGLDDVLRTTIVAFSERPTGLDAESARFDVELAPGEDRVVEIRVQCCLGDRVPPARDFANAHGLVREERRSFTRGTARVISSNEGLNDWLTRSLHDLALLRSNGERGSTVFAGIPWFACLFGRDSLLTSYAMLAFQPSLAAGTLRRLAALQGNDVNAARDEEPGKILHEFRSGEMAALGEVPFGRYYGSVDSTPLFVMLLAAYAERTADLALVQDLWPAAIAAMEWIERFGDRDGDGYVEYARRGPNGLVNQGWKDSHDCISHADGRLADPPIALAEVQAYVYAARRGLASLARRIGRFSEAADWERKAVALRDAFHRDFWMEEEGTYAIALDGDKKPCRIVASNAGHCLFGGIADAARAPRVVDRLLRDDMLSGWGIRTLSARERRYNPMSYHNGSVWPHDNAIVAAGFARAGASDRAALLLGAFLDAAGELGDRRLPELFCGFPRTPGQGPVPYPVACKPQAWSAASGFWILQSVLGLRIDGWERQIMFDRAVLPPWVENLELRNLTVGGARASVNVGRGRTGVVVELLEKEGDVDVIART